MIQHDKLRHQQGFTLVELMIALSFVAFLLIFVFTAMNQVMGSYNKGIAVKQINQTARAIAEDMSRTARMSDSQSINVSRLANGRVCFGGASYVWNVKNGTGNKFAASGNTPMPGLGLVRVEDSGEMCTSGLPDVPFDKSTALLDGSVWVQGIQVGAPNTGLVNIDIILSTSDPNAPSGNDPELGVVCNGAVDGQFCAVARFKTTVSTRNGGQ